MSWRALTVSDFVTEAFNTSERTNLTTAAGGSDDAQSVLTATIREWRAVIETSGVEPHATETFVPDSCRPHIVASARWRLLLKFPALRQLQTEERKLAAELADERLKEIADGDFAVEPAEEDADSAPSGGNWNSDAKITFPTQNERANEDS